MARQELRGVGLARRQGGEERPEPGRQLAVGEQEAHQERALLVVEGDHPAVELAAPEAGEALQAAGAEAIYLPIEGAEHSFIFNSHTPGAQKALGAIKDFLAEALADIY